MKKLDQFRGNVKFLLTDIDDTLTDKGQLGSEAYGALWRLHQAGIKIIPVTGRPAGWCEMIARMWPVDGVVGENGGFYFRYYQKKMLRTFFFNEEKQRQNRIKLKAVEADVLKEVPGAAIASDQFCRLMDLAIDFCEDIPALTRPEVDKIANIFHRHCAHAKISSIHVNGWFGDYDKLTMSLRFLKDQFGVSEEQAKSQCAFAGDSPNDEPMFQFFPMSFAVANIQNFADQLKFHPQFVSSSCGGIGFSEIAATIISCGP